MKVKQLLSTAIAAALGIGAFAVFSLGQVDLKAQGADCYYGVGRYSHGACIQSVCTLPEGQRCSGGSWGGCDDCGGEYDPPEIEG